MDPLLIQDCLQEVLKEHQSTSTLKKLQRKIAKSLVLDESIFDASVDISHLEKSSYDICKKASKYAIMYHMKEGYTIESAALLGCLMWNKMNNISYFVRKKGILRLDHSVPKDNNMETLERMCRTHHKRSDQDILDKLFHDQQKTFWDCFDEAISNVQKITIKRINDALRYWNIAHEIELFRFTSLSSVKKRSM